MDSERIPVERHLIGQVTVYDVTEDELERIENSAGGLGVDFPICLGCVTSAVSIFATLEASPPPQGLQSPGRTVCSVMVPVLLVVGLIFGIRWAVNRSHFAKIIAKIRARQVGPLGDETRELKRGELETLPLEAAPLPPIAAPGTTGSVAANVEPTPTGSEQK